jgi:NitT/TauT family transport system substrate-binding protein
MRRFSGLLVSLMTITLALTACGGSGGSSDTPTKITVGYIPVMIDAPLYVGIEKGYFQQEKLDIQLQPLAGGTDVITQTATGNFDVGLGGLGVATFNALQKNIGIKVVAPLHSETPPVTTPLVVSKKAFDSGEIKSVADLKGKKVAINAAGSATEYWLARALEKGGLKLSDVQVQFIAFPDVPAALENGAIAGAMLGEPVVTQARDKGQIAILSDDFISGFFPTIILYNTKFADGKKSAAQGFMNAYLKACRDLQGGAFKTDAIAAIVEKYTKVPADIAKRSNAPTFDPNGRFKIDDLQTMQQFYFDRGGLTYTTPLDMKKEIDTSFVDAAVKKLGEYKG